MARQQSDSDSPADADVEPSNDSPSNDSPAEAGSPAEVDSEVKAKGKADADGEAATGTDPVDDDAQDAQDSSSDAAADEPDEPTAESDDDGGDDDGGDEEPAAPQKKKGRWKKRLAIGVGSLPVLLLVGWFAVHNIPGFGPLVADTLRAVFGKAFVAWLEDTAYGVQDWFNRKTKKGAKPQVPWEVPGATATAAAPVPSVTASSSASSPSGPPPEPPFRLASVGPMHKNVATAGEGVWLPLKDPRQPNDRVRMLKTFVHPDKNRTWAIAVVVAIDLAHVEIHAMAGSHEPKARTKGGKSYKRKAIIPKEQHDGLLAAFNGGYKATHGFYGMMVDGVTIAPGRPLACTVSKYKDGSYSVRLWKDVKDKTDDMLWFRQTPVCMYDAGKPHPGLSMPKLGWGASVVSGTTVIRRSAIGISKDRKVIYIGLGHFVTGKTIAETMVHVGSHWVAQLDVNFSFPKFLTYKYKQPGSKELVAVPLTKNFEFHEQQYVGRRSHRDFFYLVRKAKKAKKP